tara:strand:- start:14934 stop:15338 length:405 start_codon:yes stop_codon:yes gene_type:complete
MGIPTWNKIEGLVGNLSRLLDMNVTMRVDVEEWARVTGRERGFIDVRISDVFDGREDEYETMTPEEIMDEVYEYFSEYQYEYSMDTYESFEIDEYQDTERTTLDTTFIVNGQLGDESEEINADELQERMEGGDE